MTGFRAAITRICGTDSSYRTNNNQTGLCLSFSPKVKTRVNSLQLVSFFFFIVVIFMHVIKYCHFNHLSAAYNITGDDNRLLCGGNSRQKKLLKDFAFRVDISDRVPLIIMSNTSEITPDQVNKRIKHWWIR